MRKVYLKQQQQKPCGGGQSVRAVSQLCSWMQSLLGAGVRVQSPVLNCVEQHFISES